MPRKSERMKKVLLAFGMVLISASSASAGGLTSRLSSSVQLTVDGPVTSSTRLGSSYSVSGSNISVTTLGGLTGSSATAPATISSGTYGIATDGQAFSFTESQLVGDTVITNDNLGSNGRFDNPTLYSSNTIQSGGTAGSLAGTIDTTGTVSLTAGGPGTSAIGQFVSEITIFE